MVSAWSMMIKAVYNSIKNLFKLKENDVCTEWEDLENLSLAWRLNSSEVDLPRGGLSLGMQFISFWFDGST
jgi:hypothetical protein